MQARGNRHGPVWVLPARPASVFVRNERKRASEGQQATCKPTLPVSAATRTRVEPRGIGPARQCRDRAAARQCRDARQDGGCHAVRGSAGSAPAERRKARRRAGRPQQARKGLISRAKAFEARGIFLQDARGSWSGVRKSRGRGHQHLGERHPVTGRGLQLSSVGAQRRGLAPWSTARRQERLEHAASRTSEATPMPPGSRERLDGHIPEDRARTIRASTRRPWCTST